MARPYALLRSGFPYHMTLGMRRVTSNAVDIALGPSGTIYVLCRGTLGTEVRLINWEDNNLGTMGSGVLKWPSSILCDKDENIYVSDEAHNKVFVFDSEGVLANSWGLKGNQPGCFNRPTGMAFDINQNIYLSDALNHRIQKYTNEGIFIAQFGSLGTDYGELNMPWGIAIDELSDIYVADWRNDRVQKFTCNGDFLMNFGVTGTGSGEFNRPTGIAVDKDGDIYVADWGNNRIQLFDAMGHYIEAFRGEANLSVSGRQYVLANPVTLRLRDMAYLEEGKRFRGPISVKVDLAGHMLVPDFGSHRIQVYKKEAYPLTADQIAPQLRSPVLFTT